jgi:hypothetical protein
MTIKVRAGADELRQSFRIRYLVMKTISIMTEKKLSLLDMHIISVEVSTCESGVQFWHFAASVLSTIC